METSKNLFTEGMSSDLDLSFQKPTTMRNNLNGRVIYNQNGSYSWNPQLGNTQLFGMNCNYGINPAEYTPIGWAEFSDKLVILSTNGVNSEIGIVTVDPYHTTKYQNYQTVYNDLYDPFGDKLNLSVAHDIISIIANEENTSIQRIYWTDAYNVDRVFNVVEGLEANNPAFNNPINPQGVDTGVGDYNPIVATGLYPTFYSAFSMDSVPDMAQGTIQFVQAIPGEKLSGVYQYCYRLVTKDGYKTPFTMPIRHIFLTTDGINMSNSSQYAMQASQLTTSKGIQIEINGIDTRYYQIEVCYIYSIAKTQSLNAAVFATLNINNQSTLTVNDISNGGTPIALDEIALLRLSFETVQALGVRENRMFKGNVTVNGVPDFEASSIAVEPYIRSMVADQRAINEKSLPFLASQGYINTTKIQKYIDNTSTPQYTTHQIKSDYITYSGMQIEHLFGGYFRGDTYRMGIVFIDKKGSPLFVYHIKDITMTQQYDNTYTVNWLDSDGNPQTDTITLGVVGDYKLTDNNAQDNPFVEGTVVTPTSNVRNRILGMMLSNIDLTDIIDDIGAFAIVRVERDPTVLAQGLLLNMVHETGGSDTLRDRPMGYPSNYFNGSGLWLTAGGNIIYGKLNTTGGYTYTEYTLDYSCPDYLFDESVIPSLQSNHKIKSVGAVHMTETPHTGNEYGYQDWGNDDSSDNGRCGISDKSEYTSVTGLNNLSGATALGVESNLNFWINFGFDSTTEGYNPANPTRILEGFVHTQDDGAGGTSVPPLTDNRLYNGGIHDGCLCINTKSLPDSSLTIGTGVDREAVCYMLANYIIANKVPYGGISADSLAQSIYIPTGHFQPINETVKAEILNGGRYVFDGVEVWGGDCYVNMFALPRIYAENEYGEPDFHHSIAIANVFPCEMKYNSALKKGNTWAKNGFIAQSPYYPNGVSKDNPEEELINESLSYSETNALYTPVPLNFSNQTDFTLRWYYSPPKIDGELVDSWRIYPVNQFSDMDGRYGDIIGCSSLSDQIYSFQQRAFGRLRVLDRVSLQDPATGGLTIGTGGVLDYIDYISTTNGTQHALSILNTGKAIYFIDVLGKTMGRFTQNGFEQIDVVHGMHNYFQALFSSSNYNFPYDNPSLKGGIHGVFDRENREVVYTFINTQELEPDYKPLSIGFSEVLSAFTGFYGFRPRKYARFGTYMLSFNAISGVTFEYMFYWHNNPAEDYGKFYGIVYDSVLAFVSNEQSDEVKAFDVLQLNSDNARAIMSNITFVTDINSDSITPDTDSRNKYREGTFWTPLRGVTTAYRSRGQYCLITITFANSGQTSVHLKSAQVNWRLSRKV